MSARRRIGLVLANGWSIKNLLHSGVMARLQQHADLLVWSQFADDPRLIELASSHGVQDVVWLPFHDLRETRAQRLLRQLQKSLFMERHRIATEEILARSSRGRRAPWQRAAASMVRIIARSPVGPLALSACSRARFRPRTGSRYAADFDRYALDLVLTCHAVDFKEDPIFLEAASRGIPVSTIVASWDNLTSKGVIYGGFRSVYVWNEQMRREVLDYYPDYESHQVVAVGVPRYEVYRAELPTKFQRAPFLSSLKLDPERRVLLFANSATSSFPEQPQVIEHLVEAIRVGELPRDLQLLIRCHPRDPYAAYSRFENLAGVTVWHPFTKSEGDPPSIYEWLPPEEDLWTLAAMMRHASVSINPFSTMTIDAAACDVPIASVAYDGNHRKPYYDSVLSAYDYAHQRPVVQSQASILCRSREELVATVGRFLNDPGLRRAERHMLANQIARFHEVDAVAALANAILADVGVPVNDEAHPKGSFAEAGAV